MISTELARALHDSGLRWRPVPGDWFRIDRIEAEEDTFILSDMTVEAHEFRTGTVIGFNGTTEWALDSVALEDALWLPREDQLRALLGPAFVALTAKDGYSVTTTVEGSTSTFRADTAEDAYARALLTLLDTFVADEPIEEP
jgi:hypothetical protein